MLNAIAWIIAALGLIVQVGGIVRLAMLRKQLRNEKDWEHNRSIRKWRHISSAGYAVVILNTVLFMIAGTQMLGLLPAGLGLLLMVPMVVLGGGEGEGAN